MFSVWHKQGEQSSLPDELICDTVPCTNARTWRSEDVIKRREPTEDMVLLDQCLRQANGTAGQGEFQDNLLVDLGLFDLSLQDRAEKEGDASLRYAIDDLHTMRGVVFVRGWFENFDRAQLAVMFENNVAKACFIESEHRDDLEELYGEGAARWGFRFRVVLPSSYPEGRLVAGVAVVIQVDGQKHVIRLASCFK